MKVRFPAVVGACLIALILSSASPAAVTTYLSRSAFEGAIAGWSGDTVDFDSAVAGDTIASGGSFDDLSFTYSLMDLDNDPLTMVVDNFFDTTSPPNYLALLTESGDFVNFVTGDSFSVGFSGPVNAFGLTIIANDTLLGGDSFSLQGDGLAQAAMLDGPAVASDTLDDGGEVYFLGMVSDQAFRSVVFSSVDTELDFALDDMTYAVVPLPPALWLLGTGLLSIAGIGRRTRRS